MNCFKLPDFLCSEINSIVGGFWWGRKEKERKIAWISWKNLCKSKVDGGMGFRDLKAFNLVLLAKQGWRILQNPTSLVHKVLKAKYFAKSSFMEAQVGKNSSYIWRSLLAARPMVQEGARWCVGDGRSIKIWDDKWLPFTESGRVVSPRPSPEANDKVDGLIVRDRAEWNVERVRSLFLPHEAEAVLSIPISPMNPRDSQVWAKTVNGLFSVKSAYKVAVKYLSKTNGGDASPGCSDNSKMAAIWKMIWNLRCDLCEESESSGHILWGCHIAREAWNEKSLKLDCPSRSPKEFIEVVWLLMETPGEKNWEEFAIMAWLLWNNRNCVRHGGSCKSGKSIAWEASKYEAEVRDSLPIQGKAAPTTSRTKHWVPPLPDLQLKKLLFLHICSSVTNPKEKYNVNGYYQS
ncbi:hypothetical protein SO802_016918 [Lithocarpus litseifolius]|uniref:Reverse transcriptase zinc-binding domain-containing protein n=1 Tax=Lithocarpus litseifolius TaxID=425828 RepID=A0AAW2CZY4_9ROSI